MCGAGAVYDTSTFQGVGLARFGGSGSARLRKVRMRSLILFLAMASVGGTYAAAAAPENTEEAAMVEATLNRFGSALTTHDVTEMQAAGIQAVSLKGWQRFFKNNPRASVTDSCPSNTLSISGDMATWDCVETATIISEGKPVPFAHVIRFSFARRNGEWKISDRR